MRCQRRRQLRAAGAASKATFISAEHAEPPSKPKGQDGSGELESIDVAPIAMSSTELGGSTVGCEDTAAISSEKKKDVPDVKDYSTPPTSTPDRGGLARSRSQMDYKPPALSNFVDLAPRHSLSHRVHASPGDADQDSQELVLDISAPQELDLPPRYKSPMDASFQFGSARSPRKVRPLPSLPLPKEL